MSEAWLQEPANPTTEGFLFSLDRDPNGTGSLEPGSPGTGTSTGRPGRVLWRPAGCLLANRETSSAAGLANAGNTMSLVKTSRELSWHVLDWIGTDLRKQTLVFSIL